jgi:(1->4)-alpha-D-glucan 1-alpha-D-glucosylmutase
MAGAWTEHVRRWLELTAELEGGPDGPDRVERSFIFQTLAGAWPIEPDRMVGYMEKALREAKRRTNWIEPDEAHEAAVERFVRGLYDHAGFRADFEPFAAELAGVGDRAALGQLLLKLTVPGLPDIYQGDELLALSLVDPDNRRAVDWERRRELLDALAAGAAPTDETRKLWLIVRALDLRARRPEAFDGDYTPLDAGPDAVAFMRGGTVLVAVVLRGDAKDVPLAMPDGQWRDVLGGQGHRLGLVLFESA